MARYTKDENGNLILTAGGTRTWIVTQAAHDRAVSAGTAPNNCLVAITDDYPTEDKDYRLTDITVNSTYAKMRTVAGICRIRAGILYVQFELNVTTEIPDNGLVFTLPDGLSGAGILTAIDNGSTHTAYTLFSSGQASNWSARGNIPASPYLTVIGSIVLA